MAAGKANALYAAEEAKAEERLHLAKGPGVKGKEQVSCLSDGGQVRDKIGRVFDVSGPMVDRGRRVAVGGGPELTKAVGVGVKDVSEAAFTLRAEDPKKHTQAEVAARLGVSRDVVRGWLDENNGGSANAFKPDGLGANGRSLAVSPRNFRN